MGANFSLVWIYKEPDVTRDGFKSGDAFSWIIVESVKLTATFISLAISRVDANKSLSS